MTAVHYKLWQTIAVEFMLFEEGKNAQKTASKLPVLIVQHTFLHKLVWFSTEKVLAILARESVLLCLKSQNAVP